MSFLHSKDTSAVVNALSPNHSFSIDAERPRSANTRDVRLTPIGTTKRLSVSPSPRSPVQTSESLSSQSWASRAVRAYHLVVFLLFALFLTFVFLLSLVAATQVIHLKNNNELDLLGLQSSATGHHALHSEHMAHAHESQDDNHDQQAPSSAHRLRGTLYRVPKSNSDSFAKHNDIKKQVYNQMEAENLMRNEIQQDLRMSAVAPAIKPSESLRTQEAKLLKQSNSKASTSS